MPQPPIQNINEASRLKRLFFIRQLATVFTLFLFAWFIHFASVQLTLPLIYLWLVWAPLALLQFIALHLSKNIPKNLIFQLIADLILIGLIIFSTGGVSSPFIFMLGIVIITAGTQAHTLTVLSTAVLAPATYLITIYTYAAIYHQAISNEQTHQILLQTSLFFLAGGIMALIARRYASLQHEQEFTIAKHQQLENIHAQVLSSMQEGIVILDDNLEIKDFNTSAAHILNIPKGIQTQLYTALNIPENMSSFTLQDELDIFRTEIHHNHLCLLVTLSRLSKTPTSWLMTIVDITETRKLERQVAEQDKLASIGQMASMLAHEIRNPMQTISQAVELMGLQMKEDKLEHIITGEISRLNRLVSDILDYASPFHPHIQHIQIKKLIQSSIDQIDLQDTHQIQVNCPDISINIDPDHFRLVADNLIRNAIHASPNPQSVHITFSLNPNTWIFSVRDYGKGISDSMRKTLFEPFRTGKKQGTGLGLATVWQACRVNGWSIHIDETIHEGTSFVVTCSHSPHKQGN